MLRCLAFAFDAFSPLLHQWVPAQLGAAGAADLASQATASHASTSPAKPFFDSIAFEAHAQFHVQRAVAQMLGLPQPSLPEGRCLLYEVHAGAARAGGVCVPSRDARGRLPWAKCAITAHLSLGLLGALQGQRVWGADFSEDVVMYLSRSITRRGYQQQVRDV